MSRATRWKVGNGAGGGFVKQDQDIEGYPAKAGDLWVAKHVTSPKGEALILITVCGFRDTPDGRRKVILDRLIVPGPQPKGGKK